MRHRQSRADRRMRHTDSAPSVRTTLQATASLSQQLHFTKQMNSSVRYCTGQPFFFVGKYSNQYKMHPELAIRARGLCPSNRRVRTTRKCRTGVMGPISLDCIPWKYFARIKTVPLDSEYRDSNFYECYDARNLAIHLKLPPYGPAITTATSPLTRRAFNDHSLEYFQRRFRRELQRIARAPRPATERETLARPTSSDEGGARSAPLTTTTMNDVLAHLHATH